MSKETLDEYTSKQHLSNNVSTNIVRFKRRRPKRNGHSAMGTIGEPKGSLFGNNGLFQRLTKEYQMKRIKDANKEKEIFE